MLVFVLVFFTIKEVMDLLNWILEGANYVWKEYQG
jgi:hypothetical protein